MTSLVRRVSDRPILEANTLEGYGPLFNAGLIHHAGLYHLFVRAIRGDYRWGGATGPRFLDYISDIVVFTSVDGLVYDFGYVLVEGSEEVCFEDPRVQRVKDRLVMTYTHLPSVGPWRIGAHYLNWTGRFELGEGTLLGPPGIENKDAVIFELTDGRIAVIQRIHPDMQIAVYDDLDHLWHATDHTLTTLMTPSVGALGIGAGAPPVLTDDGFLLFFHERRADGSYTMNVALLDSDTGQVVSRLSEPILEPELDWERFGDVNEVVFVQGAHLDGDEIYLTYGAADRCVGAAVASVPHLLAALAGKELCLVRSGTIPPWMEPAETWERGSSGTLFRLKV